MILWARFKKKQSEEEDDITDWVKENIDLVDYLGQNIKLRFKLVTDGFATGDGFYFDDITVLKIVNSIGVKEEINLKPNVSEIKL